MNIDGAALAHQIALDTQRWSLSDFVWPTEAHVPTLKVTEIEPGWCAAGAAVLVELRDGYLAPLTILKKVPSGIEFTVHWRLQGDGLHELTLRGEDGAIYARAYHG